MQAFLMNRDNFGNFKVIRNHVSSEGDIKFFLYTLWLTFIFIYLFFYVYTHHNLHITTYNKTYIMLLTEKKKT